MTSSSVWLRRWMSERKQLIDCRVSAMSKRQQNAQQFCEGGSNHSNPPRPSRPALHDSTYHSHPPPRLAPQHKEQHPTQPLTTPPCTTAQGTAPNTAIHHPRLAPQHKEQHPTQAQARPAPQHPPIVPQYHHSALHHSTVVTVVGDRQW
jgi:hypothetical protein